MISTKNILPVTTVKRNLMALLKKLDSDPLIITKDGKAAGILISPEEYENLTETLEVLSDKTLLRSLKKGEEDFKKGRTYSHEEVFKE